MTTLLKIHATSKSFSIATVGILFLILIRDPAYLLAPRIWAEEGSIYIQAYLDNGFLESIFKPQIGYYSLFANLSAMLSVALLGLQYAAYGTTYLSLLFLLLCTLAPFYLPCTYWDSTPKKILIVTTSIIISSPEIWLNTINTHFYLGLFSCYLLLSNIECAGKFAYKFSLFLLLIGSLTSVTSVVLIPFYLVKTITHRLNGRHQSTRRLTLTLPILCVGFLIQVLSFISTLDTRVGNRLSSSDFLNYPVGLARTSLYVAQGTSETISTIFILLIIGLGGVVFVCCPRLRFIAFLAAYISVVFTLLSLEMTGGERYGYIPSVLLIVYFINSWPSSNLYMSRITLLIGSLFVLYKFQYYFDTEKYYSPNWKSFETEYLEAIQFNSGFVRIFPQWEGTDWRVEVK